jgi:hypothetical protein
VPAEGNQQKQYFHEGGIPEALCRGNEFYELRPIFGCYDAALKKLPNNSGDPLVHD